MKKWEIRAAECTNCNTPTRTACVNCGDPLCGNCNEDLNRTDEADGDGLCWSCREKAAETYIGEDPEPEAWFTEINTVYNATRL